MKTICLEQATLDTCLENARHDRVILTRAGVPVALIVGLEGMDEEQIETGSSDDFWRLIAERRSQRTLPRSALEEEIVRRQGSGE